MQRGEVSAGRPLSAGGQCERPRAHERLTESCPGEFRRPRAARRPVSVRAGERHAHLRMRSDSASRPEVCTYAASCDFGSCASREFARTRPPVNARTVEAQRRRVERLRWQLRVPFRHAQASHMPTPVCACAWTNGAEVSMGNRAARDFGRSGWVRARGVARSVLVCARHCCEGRAEAFLHLPFRYLAVRGPS